MKKMILIFATLISSIASAQINKDELALKVAKAEEENLTKLKEYIWDRQSDVVVNGEKKLTTITKFSFGPDGKLEAKITDAETSIQKKPGLRGKAQQNAIEDKVEYISNALNLSTTYAFMTKGQLVDFFDKATITMKDGLIEAVAYNVNVKGDKLFVKIDPKTNLFVYKEFSSFLGTDVVEGKLNYDKFTNGTLHGTNTTLNMPAQKMTINGLNLNYTIRVK